MKKAILFIGLIVLLQSCASMFGGSSYTANISATQPNSEIYVNGVYKGKHSAFVTQSRKQDMKIEVKHNDLTKDLTVTRTIRWGSQAANILNVIYFVPIGVFIDLGTGAINKPDHKHIEEVTRLSDKNYQIIIDNRSGE